MLPRNEPLEVARPGHFEVIEQPSDYDHQLCVRQAEHHVCQHIVIEPRLGRNLLEAETHSGPLGKCV